MQKLVYIFFKLTTRSQSIIAKLAQTTTNVKQLKIAVDFISYLYEFQLVYIKITTFLNRKILLNLEFNFQFIRLGVR